MDIRQFEPIFGQWYVESLIGTGSYGRVYKIYRDELGYRYYSAMKYISVPAEESEVQQMRASGMDDRSISDYFGTVAQDITSETSLLNQLKGHSNIVSFEDSIAIPKANGVGYDIFIRMELLESLTSRLAKRSLTKDEALKLGADMCSALKLCSKYGIIHRDIKPDNIFISPNGSFKLGDFGIARKLEDSAACMSKKGTPNYMAPEVYKDEQYGASCDIYSLGLVMYQMFNKKRLPFQPDASQPMNAADVAKSLEMRMAGKYMPAPCDADRELGRIILTACAYRPEDRYASAEEFAEALLNYQNGRAEAINYQKHIDPDETVILSSTRTKPNAGKKFCPFCGNQLSADAKFCNCCGKPTGSASAPRTNPVPEQRPAAAQRRMPEQRQEPVQRVASTSAAQKEPRKKRGAGLAIALAAAALACAAGVFMLWNKFGWLLDKGPSNDGDHDALATHASDAVNTKPSTELVVEPTEYATPIPTEENFTETPTITPSPTPTPEPTPESSTVVFKNSAFESAFRNAAGITGTITQDRILSMDSLTLKECGLTDISDVAMFRNLTTLVLSGNNISDVSPIGGLNNLNKLVLNDNNISDVSALAWLTKLNNLQLANNSISEINPLSGLTDMQVLLVYGNNLTSIEAVKYMRGLTQLWAYSNSITDIEPVRNLTQMESLKLHENNISDIAPLQNLTKLKVLCLGTNQISDISPLRNLVNLEELHIKKNNISNVSPLANLTKLNYLALYYNNISDITPLYGLRNLTTLKLSNNPIPSDQIARIKELLPNCTVSA